MTIPSIRHASHEQSFAVRLKKNYQRHKALYWIALPIIAYYLIFKYLPMFGIIIAFQDYRPGKGFLHSDFVGFKNFVEFLTNPTASRTIFRSKSCAPRKYRAFTSLSVITGLSRPFWVARIYPPPIP